MVLILNLAKADSGIKKRGGKFDTIYFNSF